MLNETAVKGSISTPLHPYRPTCKAQLYSVHHWGRIKYRLHSVMLLPQTALMGCVRLAGVLFVGMNQRYPSFIQITYCSPSLCLWMKYTSQVIHIHACLQTTATCSDRNQHSHPPSKAMTIFQCLSFFPFSLMKLIK